jgi:transposase
VNACSGCQSDIPLVRLSGLVVPDRTQEDVMAHSIGPSRGDRRRNARKSRLRELVPREHAIVGVDLADEKQVFAVCDHDGKVLGRKSVKARAWQLTDTLVWARETAAAAGSAGLVAACEPTGHRWRTM